MTIAIKKNEFLGKLCANLPQQVSLPVVRAIVDQLDPILGVAFAKYEKYAEVSATGPRTVERTIPALHRYRLLGKLGRQDGPPVLWLPAIMDMQADEALRRASWLARHKDENPQNYFTAVDGNVAERAPAGRASERARNQIDVEDDSEAPREPNRSPNAGAQLESRQQSRAKARSPAHVNDREILRLVHSEWDVQGLALDDLQAPTKAILALRNSWPERLKHMDRRALRRIYQRARGRLPEGYDRWIGLVEKWDKSYNRQKARNLVDRLITALGDRRREILERMFDRLVTEICDHSPKKVRRLESECERLKGDNCYTPRHRPPKTDAIKEQVHAALADGPKTKKELARMFKKTDGAISSVGRRLRNEGKITTIRHGERFMWARVSPALPRFIPARDAIVAVLKKGPMTIPALAEATGKSTSTVKSALHRHLLPNQVIRTKFGIYALRGTEPPYISKRDAIIAALKNGQMTIRTLAGATRTIPTSLYQFIDPLLANGSVIRTKRGNYALGRTAPAFVTTCDAIIKALSKQPMKLRNLVQRVNKSQKVSRSRGAITNVLGRLKREGAVKQDGWGGEYRIVRCVRPGEDTKTVRRANQRH
jgi:hypothetical protein